MLYSRNWAWFAPGKSWWGLPLDPLSNLHDFLDNYLKKPPACYKTASAGDAGPAPDSGASAPDKGPGSDSGSAPTPDAGSARADAPPGPDAAAPASGGSGSGDSAGCSVGGPGAPALGLLALLGLAALRRRRR